MTTSRLRNRGFRATAPVAATAAAAAVVGSSSAASAAIVTIDNPDVAIGSPLMFTHLGADSWGLVSSKGLRFNRLSGDGVLAEDGPGNSFTQGADLTIANTRTDVLYASTTFGPDNGAALGLNYARLDLDANSNFETVVEFTTGTNGLDGADDFITRYAYEDTGAALNIADAVTALNATAVPEPGSGVLLGAGMLCAFVVRRMWKRSKLVAQASI